ncbi:MAG TPA: serine hydrolase domain-containing protein, partial [Polyangiaceae bacterium]|nr:serine hydrolase domain-containing protein [Polyangiaceae bacterium]
MTDPELDLVAQKVVHSGAARAAVVASAWRDGAGWQLALGAAGASPEGPIDSSAVCDLASVSKPFVAAAAARAARRSLLSLSDPLLRWLPELEGTFAAPLTLELLLSHRAGLESHRPLFAPLLARRTFERSAALRLAASARRALCSGEPPGDGYPPVYSDLGYALVGEALARAAGQPLDEFVTAEINHPLRLDVASVRQWHRQDPSFRARVLPTEIVPWRGGELRAVVHDENAWALAGHGLAGQAGLFGTAEGVARFGTSVLDAMAGRRLDWLKPAEVRPLVGQRAGGTLRAGFDGKAADQSAAGSVS